MASYITLHSICLCLDRIPDRTNFTRYGGQHLSATLPDAPSILHSVSPGTSVSLGDRPLSPYHPVTPIRLLPTQLGELLTEWIAQLVQIGQENMGLCCGIEDLAIYCQPSHVQES